MSHGQSVGHGPAPAAEDECLLEPYDSQILPVHGALLRTGKLLIFSGSGNNPKNLRNRPMEARLWNPTTNSLVRVPPHLEQRDLFCSGHCLLPDGRLLVAGGNVRYPPAEWLPGFVGIRDSFLFDPDRERWLRIGDMSDGRWYPTCVALPDGNAAAFSGLLDSLWKVILPPFGLLNRRVELWEPGEGTVPAGADRAPGRWTDLRANKRLAYYPRVHLTPLGELLRVGPERRTLSFDPSGRRWKPLSKSPGPGRYQGTSVLLPLRPPEYEARILALGGSRGEFILTKSTNSAEILDRTRGTWAWRPAAPMTFPRRHVNATLLLDGRVLATGGARKANGGPVYEAELFDPHTETWRLGATCHVPRVYHSIAVLLPDGRVWTGGGNVKWGVDELRIELYVPGYHHDPNRPRIHQAPSQIRYGDEFDAHIESTQPTEAAIVRASSVTHSFNPDQRWIGLEISARGQGFIRVRAPPRRFVAPPGWYMLTILDKERRASPGHWIQLRDGLP